MELTKREEHVWEQLQEWHQSLYNYEPTDLEHAYDRWLEKAFSLLPEEWQNQFFDKLDDWLYQLNSLLRSSKIQSEAKERILGAARSMNDQILDFNDLKKLSVDQLTFLAEQEAAKHRLYSLLQGGVVGSGKGLAITSDFLAMLVINLRATQLIAMSFGHDVHSPASLRESLRVFNVATMPDRIRMLGWEQLMGELHQNDLEFYLDSPKRITDLYWIDEPLKQLLKTAFILMFSERKVSGLPLISVMIGAGMNYQKTRKVTQFAMKYYQYKHLYEKRNGLL